MRAWQVNALAASVLAIAGCEHAPAPVSQTPDPPAPALSGSNVRVIVTVAPGFDAARAAESLERDFGDRIHVDRILQQLGQLVVTLDEAARNELAGHSAVGTLDDDIPDPPPRVGTGT